MEEPKSIYGNLDTANECIKRVSIMTKQQWDSGSSRMRLSDIKRARKYIKESLINYRSTLQILKNFETIAPVE